MTWHLIGPGDIEIWIETEEDKENKQETENESDKENA